MEKKKITNSMRTLGSTSITKADREENDFYATEPKAVELLLAEETFANNILEPCCGKKHITNVLEQAGYTVKSSDLIDRGVGADIQDFFKITEWDGDIISNPPYKNALDFVKHSLEIVKEGSKVAMFLKILFLEGKTRKEFFLENPPKVIYVASGRLNCAKNGDFDKYTTGAVCYAWFVWEKGFTGEPVVRWIN